MLSPADEALLNDLLDGRLAPADAARVRARLAAEPQLAAAWDRLQHLSDLLQDDEGCEPPAALVERVRAAVAAEPAPAASSEGAAPAPSGARPGSLPPAWRRVVVAAYALAAMLVLAVGAIALQHGREQQAPVLQGARAPRETRAPQAPSMAEDKGVPAPQAAAEGAPELPSGERLADESLADERLDGGLAGRGGTARERAAAPAAPVAGAAEVPPGAPSEDANGWSLPPADLRKAKAEALEAEADARRAGELAREAGNAPRPSAAPAAPPPAERLERTRMAPRDAAPPAAPEAARLADREAQGGARSEDAPAPTAGPFQAPGGAVPPGVRRAVPGGGGGGGLPAPAAAAPASGPARGAEPARDGAPRKDAERKDAEREDAQRADEDLRRADAARALEHVFVIEAESADAARAVLERVLAGPGAEALPPEPGFTEVRLRRVQLVQDAALLVSLGVLPPPPEGAPALGGGGAGGGSGRGAAAPATLPRVLADVQRAVTAEQYGRLSVLAGPAPARAPQEARAAPSPELRLLRILVVAPRR